MVNQAKRASEQQQPTYNLHHPSVSVLSPLAVHSPQLAVVRVDCSLGPAALVQASPPLPCVPSPPHPHAAAAAAAIKSIIPINSTQPTPAHTLAHSNPPSIMPRLHQRQLAPTPAPFLPLAPYQPNPFPPRQAMDDDNCTSPARLFLHFPLADRRCHSHLEPKDPTCMFVDPAVITCYPTNETVAQQNQYTRVICEYPSLPSPTARLVPFRHQFHFPGGRWFLTLHGVSNYTITRPPVSHMLPPYMNPCLRPTPDPTKFRHLASPPQITTRILRQGTLVPQPYYLSALSNILPFRACHRHRP